MKYFKRQQLMKIKQNKTFFFNLNAITTTKICGHKNFLKTFMQKYYKSKNKTKE